MKKKFSVLIMLAFMFCLCLGFQTSNFDCFAVATNQESQGLEIKSKSALLMDYDSGKVLYEKNPDERLPIASMTKIASLAVIFETIEKGVLKESDMVMVSENAGKVGGSSAFLDAGSSYKVSELIKSIVIASANDSCVALAEHVAGSEELFVSKMNKLARELGLNNTNFANSTGLPTENHYSSANDIAVIYKTICNNQMFRKYSKVWMEDFVHPSGRKTGLVNTNRMIKTFDGIEGGKTGYTDLAKFCLTASASRSGLRLIGVVIGAEDSKTRFAEMSRLFSYGFANFESKCLVNSEAPIAMVKFKSAKEQVAVYAERDAYVLLPKGDALEFSTDYQIYDKKAPIKQGEEVGKLFVFDKNNMVVDEIKIITRSDIFELSVKDSMRKIVGAW